MAYNQAIPQSTQRLKDSQPQLLANFQALYDFLNVNHAIFGTGSSLEGKHKWVSFPVQAAIPSPIETGEDVIYNKLYNPGTNKNELYVHKQTASGTAEIPFTASILSSSASPGDSGWTYLPSGLILSWCQISGTGATSISSSLPRPTGGSLTVLTLLATRVDINTTPSGNVDVLVSSTSRIYFYSVPGGGPAAGRANVFAIGY